MKSNGHSLKLHNPFVGRSSGASGKVPIFHSMMVMVLVAAVMMNFKLPEACLVRTRSAGHMSHALGDAWLGLGRQLSKSR
jgi:hypothetical protein